MTARRAATRARHASTGARFEVAAVERAHRSPYVGPTTLQKRVALAVAIAGVAVTGGIDYITGYEVRVFPIYFLPVALVAWRLSRNAALALAGLSTVAWTLANAAAGRTYHHSYVLPINVVTQFVAFATVGVLVAELQRRLERERDLGRTDELTALPNRRDFQERGALLISLARRSRRPITLAYVDLDNFKRVNDERGHREGNRALVRVAEVLRTRHRSTDLIARLGGDEFVVLMPDTGADAARIALERLREELGAAMRQHAWPCTASVGAVAYLGAPVNLEAAIHDADALMYRAKQAGKNRVLIETVERDATAAMPVVSELASAGEPPP